MLIRKESRAEAEASFAAASLISAWFGIRLPVSAIRLVADVSENRESRAVLIASVGSGVSSVVCSGVSSATSGFSSTGITTIGLGAVLVGSFTIGALSLSGWIVTVAVANVLPTLAVT